MIQSVGPDSRPGAARRSSAVWKIATTVTPDRSTVDAVPTPDAGRLAAHRAARAEEVEALRAGTATTLAVVATDATVTKAGCQKLAGVSHDGFARALSPVHTSHDGDTVFALATGARPAVVGLDEVDLQTAAADCVARAIVRAVLGTTSVDRTADGGVALASYRDALTTGR